MFYKYLSFVKGEHDKYKILILLSLNKREDMVFSLSISRRILQK